MCHLEHEMERLQLLQRLRQQQQNSKINSLADLQASQTISLGGSASSHYGHEFGCCENGVDFGTLLALLAGKKNLLIFTLGQDYNFCPLIEFD